MSKVQEPLILLLESATSVCSVGLCKGMDLLALRESKEGMEHATKMPVFVDEILKEQKLKAADLDAIAISIGPGSYTGLRIGASLAKGIAYTNKLPILAISSLKSVASVAKSKFHESEDNDYWYVPMLDARRMDVFTRVYSTDLEPLSSTLFLDLTKNGYQKYFNLSKKVIYCGNCVSKTIPNLQSPSSRFLEICSTAKGLIQPANAAYHSGHFEDLVHFSPQYLKKPNITKSKKAKF